MDIIKARLSGLTAIVDFTSKNNINTVKLFTVVSHFVDDLSITCEAGLQTEKLKNYLETKGSSASSDFMFLIESVEWEMLVSRPLHDNVRNLPNGEKELRLEVEHEVLMSSMG